MGTIIESIVIGRSNSNQKLKRQLLGGFMTTDAERNKIYDDLQSENLERLEFKDPFEESTRKAKRNLLVGCLVTVLISTFGLQFKSAFGLEADAGGIKSSVVSGIAFFCVLYLWLQFAVQAYVDYKAWIIRKETIAISPYLRMLQISQCSACRSCYFCHQSCTHYAFRWWWIR